MQNSIADCEQAGQADGLAAGLALALADVSPDAAPGPHAALPTGSIPPGAALVRHDLAAAQGIGFVRPARRLTVPTSELTALAARLAAVRLGAVRRLAELAVEYLSDRVSGGEPMIRKQLVQGSLADARVATEAAHHCLLVSGHHSAAVVDVHDRLTTVDWELARLLGASGYVDGGPVCRAYVSWLTANCWLRREDTPR